MHRIRHRFSLRAVPLIVVALCVALLAPGLAIGMEQLPAPNGKVIMVLLDGVSYEELAAARLPAFERLAEGGCIGLMTVPLGVMPRNASAYATIGSGYTIPSEAAPLEYSLGFDADEMVDGSRAASVYARNTGQPTGGAQVVNPGLPALERAYDAENVNGVPGALGTALHRAGKRTALIGNADGGRDGILDRAAMLIAMDSSGTVDFGSVGSGMYVADDGFAFGVRSETQRVARSVRSALRDADFVVVESGDTRRARAEAPFTTARAAKAGRLRALKAADELLGELVGMASDQTLLLVVSPSAPDDLARQGKALAPVFAMGGMFPNGGSLYSPTTRQGGVIAPHDLAPTVLAHFGLRPEGPMIGLAVSGRAETGAASSLLGTLARAGDLHRERGSALGAFIIVQIALLLVLSLPEIQSWLGRDVRRWALPFMLATGSLAMLLQPLLGPLPLVGSLAVTAVMAVAMALALAMLRSPIRALLVLSAAATVLVAVDVALGAPLTRWSFLGYDLVTGGRFYGIGNEFAGVLVGASLAAAACTVALTEERYRRVVVALVGLASLALIVLFALPTLGADAGGALSGAVGYGVALYGFAGGRLGWRRVALLGAALLAVALGGLFLANVVLAQSDGSHVGRFLVRIASGDFGFVTSTILRKLRANAHLLTVSIWSRLLIVSFVLGGLLAVRYRTQLLASVVRDRALWHGLVGMAAGGLAALALNDSGVVMLATMSPFVILLMMVIIARGLDFDADSASAAPLVPVPVGSAPSAEKELA